LHRAFAITPWPTKVIELTSTGSGRVGGKGGNFLPQPEKAIRIVTAMKGDLILMGQ
jgi:hypothetical protein